MQKIEFLNDFLIAELSICFNAYEMKLPKKDQDIKIFQDFIGNSP